jgi:uncharacterized membrane protein YtjA (UPF0391 family)
MFRLAILCLIIALIAALLGYGGLAGSFVGVAEVLFMVFLAMSAAFAIGAAVYRKKMATG